MNDPPIHPVTGDPITAEQLVADSDKLDEILASGDFAGLVSQVASMRDLQRKADRLARIVTVFALIAVLSSVFGTYWALRVDHNTRDLHQTKTAIQVFCETTNIYNAEARENLPGLVPDADPTMIARIAKVMWPQRDCTTLINEPTTAVTLP